MNYTKDSLTCVKQSRLLRVISLLEHSLLFIPLSDQKEFISEIEQLKDLASDNYDPPGC